MTAAPIKEPFRRPIQSKPTHRERETVGRTQIEALAIQIVIIVWKIVALKKTSEHSHGRHNQLDQGCWSFRVWLLPFSQQFIEQDTAQTLTHTQAHSHLHSQAYVGMVGRHIVLDMCMFLMSSGRSTWKLVFCLFALAAVVPVPEPVPAPLPLPLSPLLLLLLLCSFELRPWRQFCWRRYQLSDTLRSQAQLAWIDWAPKRNDLVRLGVAKGQEGKGGIGWRKCLNNGVNWSELQLPLELKAQ